MRMHSAEFIFLFGLIAIPVSGCDSRVPEETKESSFAADVQEQNRRIRVLEEQLISAQTELEASRRREEDLNDRLSALQGLLEEYLAPETTDDAATPDGNFPDAPVERAVNEYTQQIRYLKITLKSFQMLNDGQIQAKLVFFVNDEHRGAVMAAHAEGSDGIMDYWKFFPKSTGTVTDSYGNRYEMIGSPIGFARDNTDWLILEPGDNVEKVFVFRPSDGTAWGDAGIVFSVNVDVRVGMLNEMNKQVVSLESINFDNVSQRR